MHRSGRSAALGFRNFFGGHSVMVAVTRCTKLRIQLDIAITIAVVAFTIVLLAWLGDWTGSRKRRLDDSYWLSSHVSCPSCKREFTPQEVHSRGTMIYESKYFGAVLTCSVCETAYEFFRTEAEPSYVGLSSQFRRCLDCDDCYNGIPTDCCPSCGSKRSQFDRSSPFGLPNSEPSSE